MKIHKTIVLAKQMHVICLTENISIISQAVLLSFHILEYGCSFIIDSPETCNAIVKNYSPLSSVKAMQEELSLRSFGHRRLDCKVIMFYKKYHNQLQFIFHHISNP
jgi:hypothetical protein